MFRSRSSSSASRKFSKKDEPEGIYVTCFLDKDLLSEASSLENLFVREKSQVASSIELFGENCGYFIFNQNLQMEVWQQLIFLINVSTIPIVIIHQNSI